MRAAKSIHASYEFLGLAGSGQYGQVYCARQRRTGQIVALKELPHGRFPTHALLRELRVLLMLNHPHVTRCEALEHAQEGRYLVLEYCEGGTLRDWLEQGSPLPLKQVLAWIRQILLGLDHAHTAGVIHCDVKPENILLHLSESGWQMKLTDFGIARVYRSPITDLSMTGSAAYMAPERFYGQFSPAVDIYAVGVMLYEMILGSRPFSGSPGQLMHDHLNRRVVLAPELPAVVRAIVQKALEKLPARRYGSAALMVKDLDAILPQLEEPLVCWVGPLLPRGSLHLQATFSLPTRPEVVVGWQDACWWAQRSQLWRTDPTTEQSTLMLALDYPLRHLIPVGTGLLLVSDHHLDYWLPDHPLIPLRAFRDPWRWQCCGNNVVWATQREYGVIHFASSASPFSGRSFYHQTFPRSLPQPPLIWLQDQTLTLGIPRQGTLELYQQPVTPWQPLNWQQSALWTLPLCPRSGIPFSTGAVLVPRDPQAELLLLHTHPLRLRRLDLPSPWQGIIAVGKYIHVVTQAQHLITWTTDGDGYTQTLLPQPYLSFDSQGSLWLASAAASGTQLWQIRLGNDPK